jgi:hypothetical protein
VVFPLAVLHPRCEVTKFTIIAVIREPHLRADKEDFLVMYDDPAIVNYVLVHNRPSKTSVTEKNKIYAGVLTSPNRKRCPWFRPMIKSSPKLPMNEGQYRLHDDEQLIMPAVIFQTFQKVVVTTIATSKSKSLLEHKL